MKRFIIVAIALAAAVPAGAQLYKWVDKDGKTHYSDTPPAGQDSKSLSVGSGATSPTATAAAGSKSAVDRDKDAEKSRQASREAGKKAEDATKNDAAREEACSRAKAAYQTYADGGRIHKYNDKGERDYLGDEEIEKERVRTQREMNEVCKTT